MSVRVEKKDDVCMIVVEKDMTIFNSTELKKLILKPLNDCSNLKIDLSQVGEIDSSGFQLLMLLKKECESKKIAFQLVDYSNAVRSLLELFNMVDYFQGIADDN